jgi:hypothetical protein
MTGFWDVALRSLVEVTDVSEVSHHENLQSYILITLTDFCKILYEYISIIVILIFVFFNFLLSVILMGLSCQILRWWDPEVVRSNRCSKINNFCRDHIV